MSSIMKHIALLLLALAACAALAPGAALCGDNNGKPREPKWFHRAKLALPLAKKSGKPMLLTLGFAGDLRSWELRRSVFATDEFRRAADKFLLCRDTVTRDDLKALGIKVSGKDLGCVIFLSPEGEEMERVQWTGEPGLVLSVIMRVAEGNSISRLRSRVSKNPGDVGSLKTLYGAYAEKREAGLALETLAGLKSADEENRKRYEALAAYWGVVLLMEKEQWAEALKEIDRIAPGIEDAALHDDLLIRKARVTFQKGGRAEALSQLRDFISKNPDSPMLEAAYRRLITILNQLRRTGEVMAAARDCLRALPESRFATQVIFNLASRLYRARRYAESRKLLRLVAGRIPGLAASEQADILYRAMTYGAAWKKRLLLRRKALDVMYVVPDTATLLYYVSLWDERTFFPVLVNSGSKQDRRLIQKFAVAFKPSRIIVAPARKDVRVDRANVLKAVLTSWNGDDLDDGINATPKAVKKELERLNIAPMGIVFTDIDSDGFLAGAVALAAGRFELIDFPKTDGTISKEINGDAARNLRADLVKKIEAWGYAYRQMFDDIDFVTFALDMPLKFKARDHHLYCVDDFVTRREDEVRYAYPGRLMEGVTRANYMAMCSLFLQPGKALFFNTYRSAKGGFKDYATAGAAGAMKKMMPAANFEGGEAGLRKWRSLMGRVNTFGYLHVNSAGGKDIWWVGGAKAGVTDIPAESIACVMHMTHSFSAVEPWDPATIAGRWLNAGAYVYFGSTYEPFLKSFRTPARTAVALAESEPLSAAYRQGFGEAFWIPWRLCYFGDPMYVLTGVQPTRAKAADAKLREGEKEFRKLDDIFGDE